MKTLNLTPAQMYSVASIPFSALVIGIIGILNNVVI